MGSSETKWGTEIGEELGKMRQEPSVSTLVYKNGNSLRSFYGAVGGRLVFRELSSCLCSYPAHVSWGIFRQRLPLSLRTTFRPSFLCPINTPKGTFTRENLMGQWRRSITNVSPWMQSTKGQLWWTGLKKGGGLARLQKGASFLGRRGFVCVHACSFVLLHIAVSHFLNPWDSVSWDDLLRKLLTYIVT